MTEQSIVRHYRAATRDEVEQAYRADALKAARAGYVAIAQAWSDDANGPFLAVTYSGPTTTHGAEPDSRPAPDAPPEHEHEPAPAPDATAAYEPAVDSTDAYEPAAAPSATAETVTNESEDGATEESDATPSAQPTTGEPAWYRPVERIARGETAHDDASADRGTESHWLPAEPDLQPEREADAAPEDEPGPQVERYSPPPEMYIAPRDMYVPVSPTHENELAEADDGAQSVDQHESVMQEESVARAEPAPEEQPEAHLEPAVEPAPDAAPEMPTLIAPESASRQARLTIQVMDLHTAGEPLRLVRSGFPDVPMAPVLERRQWVKDNVDYVRRALMYEPRGHRDMYGAILLPPYTDYADMTVLFMHNEGYSTMCGHGVIANTTGLIEEGLFPATEPVTTIR
jgi:hypothetical protein